MQDQKSNNYYYNYVTNLLPIYYRVWCSNHGALLQSKCPLTRVGNIALGVAMIFNGHKNVGINQT